MISDILERLSSCVMEEMGRGQWGIRCEALSTSLALPSTIRKTFSAFEEAQQAGP